MAKRAREAMLTSGRVMLAIAAILFVVLALAPAASGAKSQGGQLQPSPVGDGQCSYDPWTNGAPAGQVAESNTTCTVAERVLMGSASARGAAYHADGFAQTEGPHTDWSGTWRGAYHAYDCVDGSGQIAFNWGTDYTY